jgi:transposase
MSNAYRVTEAERAQIRALYSEGVAIRVVAQRLNVTARFVSAVVQDIKRGYSGWRDGLCKCGPAGWTPVQEQLNRRKLLDDAKAGEPIALRRLNAMGLRRWERAGEVVVGECHVAH